jgi:hypothetical protein
MAFCGKHGTAMDFLEIARLFNFTGMEYLLLF